MLVTQKLNYYVYCTFIFFTSQISDNIFFFPSSVTVIQQFIIWRWHNSFVHHVIVGHLGQIHSCYKNSQVIYIYVVLYKCKCICQEILRMRLLGQEVQTLMILVDIVRFSFLGVMLFCIPISMDLECLFLTALPIVCCQYI